MPSHDARCRLNQEFCSGTIIIASRMAEHGAASGPRDGDLLAELLTRTPDTAAWKLLDTLLAEPPRAKSPAKRRHTRRRVRAAQAAGAALLACGALALAAGPFSTRAIAAVSTVASTQIDSAALARSEKADLLATLREQRLAALQSENQALLLDLLASAPPTHELAPSPADVELAPGTELVIPVLEQEPVLEGEQLAPAAQGVLSYYTVQPGDTLSGIALSCYGNANLWGAIYDANANIIANPNLIYPNQRLTIPVAPPYGFVIPPGQPPFTGSGPGVAGNYVVQSGDTLSGIALAYYGNANLWPTIYNANAGVIGGNPNLIITGQVLYIP